MNILIGNDHGLKGGGTEKRISLILDKFLQAPNIKKIYFLSSSDLSVKNEKFVSLKAVNPAEAQEILNKLFSKDRIDIAQFHNLCLYNALPISIAKKNKVPVIWFAHDYWGFCGQRNLIYKSNKVCSGFNLLKCISCIGLKSTYHILKLKSILNLADLGVGVSDFIIRSYEKENILRNKWIKLEPWVDLDNLPEPNNLIKEESIFYTGPLSWHKGIFDLLDAFTLTLRIYPNLVLKIAGPDQEEYLPSYIKFREKIKRSRLENKIKLLGYLKTEELYSEIKKSSIYVSPPIWNEPLGLNWLEALTCKVPVVTTAVGGITEYARDKVILVKPQDPEELSRAIIKVLENKSQLDSEETLKYIKVNFNAEKAFKKLIEIYDNLLKN